MADNARAGRRDLCLPSRTESTLPSVSLGSCQPPGGGSRGLAGPQPGLPVLPAPHLRQHPGFLGLWLPASAPTLTFDLPSLLSSSTHLCFALSPFSWGPFFLSLASSFPLFFEMVSFILGLSLVFLVFLSHPTPSLSRLFTYEGLFSLRVALSSEIHKSKSDHCPPRSPQPFL